VITTEAKQGWTWSEPGWENPWENKVAAGWGVSESCRGVHNVVSVGPNASV